jgi:hypothetical protein
VLLNHYSKNNYIITALISATHIPDGNHSTPDVIDLAFLSNITSHHTIKTLSFLSHLDYKLVTSTVLGPVQSHGPISTDVCGDANGDYFRPGVQLKSGPYFNMSNLFTNLHVHGSVHHH